ncbi:AsmA family protein [Dyella monticola]|uniref:AsmA family protein n=1 Tax=Dyella monticola TaxID=1927958 RepID=A0A370WYL3_9GAMM|nr:AsmA family protein [Dyella monticola]RDS81176.1 AsmA family protein [Dyella monticola]
MRLSLKILAWMVGVLTVLVVALILFVAFFDWNRLKPTIDDKASAALSRPFIIRGDLTAAWRRSPTEHGLGSLMPWPTFTARDIRIGNPAWARQSQFVELDAAVFRLSPLPLLIEHIYVPSVQLVGLHVDLERNSQGQANWDISLPTSQKPSNWTFTLGTIGLDKGDIALDDAKNRLNLHVGITPLQQAIAYDQLVKQASSDARADVGHGVGSMVNESQTSPDISPDAQRSSYQFAWTVNGSYQGAPVNGHGKSGAVLALQQTHVPFPVQARVHIDDSKIALVGTLTDPLHLGALNLRLWFAGSSMAKLYPIIGISLPDTPPYATEGHLSAQLHYHGSHFEYRNFKGRVGESDLGGNIQVTTGGARPTLSGDVHSQTLRFVDLASLVGAGNETQKQARGDTTSQPTNKALPVEQFHTDRLRAMDADLSFDAAHIEHPSSLPIDALTTHIYLDNGVLRLDPLHAGVAGGTIDGKMRMDASAEPMRTTFDLRARRVHLKQLFPTIQSMQNSLGEINANATLNTTGDSPAGLMGNADGDVKLMMENGEVSKTLLEAAGLNVANVVIEKLFGDKTVHINCLAADMDGTDGTFTSRLFVLDTSDAIINVTGTIDFRNEQLNLDVVPHTKGLRIFSLRSPLYVKGTFKNPDVGVHPGPLLLRGGGALALGIVAAPLAALVAVVVPSRDQHNDCQQVLTTLRHEQPSGPAQPGAKGK